MTLNECYDAMGADYQEVQGRLRTDERIQKFLLKLPKDPSYETLCDSLERKEIEEAFRAAHTLKGVSQNLALTRLYRSADALCEALRGKQTYDPAYEPLLAAVREDYAMTMECVSKLTAG
jgi:HPt (histidine-containing phosphotransfer) domain-containing protein